MSQRCTTTMCLKFLRDMLEDEFALGVPRVEPKGLDKDLPQDAFVVDCEDEAHGETDSAATTFETIRSRDAHPDVFSAIDRTHQRQASSCRGASTTQGGEYQAN